MPKSTTPPLVIVDGSSYLFRAYHGLPDLTNANGEPTGAMYGVINMLKKLVAEYAPTHVAVVFDTKGKNFRHALYPDYKANRGEMPEELEIQIAPLHEMIVGMGLPLIMHTGVEADDVIGTIAQQAAAEGFDVLISTGDKDMAQLVNKQVTLVNTMTNKTMGPAGVIEKFGVPAEAIIDYLALVGDTSDNVPGVPGVGPKTAAKWLNAYGSLDDVVKHADEITGKVGENLRAHLTQLSLAKELVTIRCDVQLHTDEQPHALALRTTQTDILRNHFKRYGFTSWLRQLTEIDESQTAKAATDYEAVTTTAQWAAWVKKLNKNTTAAIDTETTHVNPMLARLVGLSISVASGEACYVPFAHDYPGAPEQLDKAAVLSDVQRWIMNDKHLLVGQNLKYDLKVLRHEGVHCAASCFDTMLASYLVNGSRTRHDLDTLALKYLDHENISFESIAGKGKNQLTFNDIDVAKATDYAAEDADITLQLYQQLSNAVEENTAAKKIFHALEIPLMHVLTDIEYNGVLVDREMLAAQSETIQAQLNKLEEEIYSIAGETFNIASPKQIGEIFYEKLQLPIIKKTPKGQPSTAEPVLEQLAVDYPLPQLILDYRGLAKLKSTYTDKLPQDINPTTGRIHTSYHQAATATGRLASKDPNLQNIPTKSAQGRAIREAFIAPKGYQILSADYSQVELRIMAHLSQDKGLLQAFAQGLDVHRATAAEVMGKKLEDVTAEDRRRAKAVNFGLIYGMSAFGLSQQLKISRQEAQSYMDIYFERYPGVLDYMEQTRAFAHAHGYVETLMGRQLHLPDIHSKNVMQQKAAERAAINAPMQGTAADIIKVAMIDIHLWMQKSAVDAKMIMQVHDELVFEVGDAQIERFSDTIRTRMANAAALAVPLIVDIGVGDSWAEAH